MIIALLLSVVAIVLTTAVVIHYTVLAPPIPGVHLAPGSLPIVGHLFSLLRHRQRWLWWKLDHAEAASRLRRKGRSGGDAADADRPVECWQWHVLGVREAVVELLSPRLVESVLSRDFSFFSKRNLSRYDDLLGSGIFNSDAAEWKQQRRLLAALFSQQRLHCLTRSCCIHASQLVAHLRSEIASASASSPPCVDLQSLFFSYTFSSLCSLAFTSSLPLSPSQLSAFGAAFDRAQEICTARFMLPDWLWRTKRRLGIGDEAELRRCMQVVHDCVDELVSWSRAKRERRRAQRQEEEAKAVTQDERDRDLVSLFLDDAEERGQDCDSAYLRDVIVNFMLAGRDTTACALSWLFFRLCRHPRVLQRLRLELSARPSSSSSSSSSPLPSPSSHPFLFACMNETLRLHPPIAFDAKRCSVAVALPDGSCIPAGSTVFYTQHTLQRLHSLWGETAASFSPDRWLDTDGRLLSVSPFAFPVFNAGKRLCLGRSAAYEEMAVLAVELIDGFDFELMEGERWSGEGESGCPPVRLSIVAAMRDGLHVRVNSRAVAGVK